MRILVGYNESSVSDEALNAAIMRAKAFKAGIDIVHSLKSEGDDYNIIERAQAELDLKQKRISDLGIECEVHLLIRDLEPGEDLVTFAKDNYIDEIVIGVKKRSKVEKAIFGSTAQYVILNAPCPVLAVKAFGA